MGIVHWLIVLLVVVLIFGTKKLRNFGEDLGNAVRGFKEGMKNEDGKKPTELDASSATNKKDVTSKIEQTDKTE